MDSVTLIRVVAGVVAVIVLAVIIARRKRTDVRQSREFGPLGAVVRMETIAVLNRTRETVLGERVSVAGDEPAPNGGLTRQPRLEPGTGLLILRRKPSTPWPCASRLTWFSWTANGALFTCGMRWRRSA